MSVNSVNEQSSVLSDLSINNKPKKEVTTEKDMFMRLMLTQLKNQNPLNPKDGAEFVSQLAQFSSLEGIGNVNKSIEKISSLYRSSQALQATTLVGRDVLVDSDIGFFDEKNPVIGMIKAPSETALDAKVTITDAKGQVVRTETLGNISPGKDTPFAWDGADDNGNKVEAGKYKIAVSGRVANKIEALNVDTFAKVSSVSILGNSGDIELNLNGLDKISSTDIKEVR